MFYAIFYLGQQIIAKFELFLHWAYSLLSIFNFYRQWILSLLWNGQSYPCYNFGLNLGWQGCIQFKILSSLESWNMENLQSISDIICKIWSLYLVACTKFATHITSIKTVSLSRYLCKQLFVRLHTDGNPRAKKYFLGVTTILYFPQGLFIQQ